MALSIDADSLAARLRHAITISLPSVSLPSLSASTSQDFQLSPPQSLENVVKERGCQSVFSCPKCKSRLIRGVETCACIVCGSPQQLAMGKLSQFSYQKSYAFQRFLHSLTPKNLENRDIPLHIASVNQTLGSTTGDSLHVSSIEIERLPLGHSKSFGEFEKAGISDASISAKSIPLEGPEIYYPEGSLLSAFRQKTDLNIIEDRKHAPDFSNLDDLFLNVSLTQSGSSPAVLQKDENLMQVRSEYDFDFISRASNSDKAVASSMTETLTESKLDLFDGFFSTEKTKQEMNAQKGGDLIDITPFGSDGEMKSSVNDFPDLESLSGKSSSAVSTSLNFFSVNEEEKGLFLFSSQSNADAKGNSPSMEETWEEDDFQWTSATSPAELVLATSGGATANQNVLNEDFLLFQPSLNNLGSEERQPEIRQESFYDVFQLVNDKSNRLAFEDNEYLGGLEKRVLEVNSTASSSLRISNGDGWQKAVSLNKVPQDAPRYHTEATEDNLSRHSGLSLKEKTSESGSFKADPNEKNPSIQTFLSQIHDLSFMLKDHLVIPENNKIGDHNDDFL